MASEQARIRKKQTRDISKSEDCPQVLYRHQDCIPDSKLLQSCDRYNLLSNKVNQSIGCSKKSAKEQNITKQTNKTSTSDFKSKEANKNNQQGNSTDCNNEELSKSRKRRLRKRRLLESLAPTLNGCTKPNPSLSSSSLKTKLYTQVYAQSSSVTQSPAILTCKPSEPAKLSPKDSKKRLDKSVSLRVKSTIKNKALVEPSLNQYKANLIKSLEGKSLNSLLQTLAPLGNLSPSKDSTSSKFSFQDKNINNSASKVGKDGVFYFGETKHQLEKLATGFNKNNSSNLIKGSPKSAQEKKPDTSILSSSSSENTINCLSTFKFSPTATSSETFTINNLTSDKELISFTSTAENGLFIPNCLSNELCLTEPSVKNLSLFPKFNLTSPVLPSPFLSNRSIIDSVKGLDSSISSPKNIQNPNLSHSSIAGFKNGEQVSVSEGDNQVHTVTMKSSEEVNKPNKTREEVMLEREAKKAAKMAAKAKHKNLQTNKAVSETSNVLVSQNNELVTETNKIDTQTSPHQKVKDKMHHAITVNVNVPQVDASTQQVSKVPLVKDCTQEPAGKSKAELRAERRAKQEIQRAAKLTNKTPQNQPKDKIPADKNTSKIVAPIVKLERKSDTPTNVKIPTQVKPKLFSHLYREKPSLTSDILLSTRSLHPAIVRLGVQYSKRVVAGSNARCVALLQALKEVVKDYTTPLEKEFSRGLEEELGSITVFLDQCRPLAVSMTNALRHIKRTLTQLPNNIPDIEARRKICDIVDTYIHEQIDVAGEAICNRVIEKIADEDVILTYGCSSLVYQILVKSHMNGTNFRVVIVDGLPWREGREMLRRLVDKGIACTYVLITAASFIMREASKVLLGAHALLANGYVMARAGSSQVALLAHCNNVPVLVCCETHKFCERVQTDAFVYNEIGEISCENIKDKEKGKVLERMTPLSLAYDITPPDLVSAVVTELAVLPCTSVPVILRIKPSESVM